MTGQGSTRERIGDYEILAKLSSGGMGDVLLVRRSGVHKFEKLAAVKIIRGSLPQLRRLRTMFLDEARLMARISHPNIAQVYDFGEDHGRLFLVMEYVPGIPFKELIERRPPPVIAARAMAEVCLGLHAAHQLTDLAGQPLGVVHRDVSPQNLMLTFDGCIKILDFGIALMRDRETQATQCGEIKGKPAYMAPEQVKNRQVDRRTDVFAAAIVLHELLTGSKLFTGESIYAIAREVERARIRSPSSLAGPMPPGLDDVVMRGLQRNPARRYQSALEMAQALNGVVATIRGETLEQYAPRELSQARVAHLEWLQQVLSGEDPGALEAGCAGRPEGVATAQVAISGRTGEGLAGTIPTQETGNPAGAARSIRRHTRRGSRSSRWLAAALVAAALATGGAAALWWPPGDVAGSDADAVVRDEAGTVPSGEPSGEDVTGRMPASGATGDTGRPDRPPTGAGEKTVPPRRHRRLRRRRARPHRRRRPTRREVHKLRPAADAGQTPAVQPEPVHVAPAEEPAVIAKEAFAWITIAADPYANVRIDGREAGITPIFRRKLAAGAHRITLISPDTGKVRYEHEVNLGENEHKQVILGR